jgi:hypothetical protein
VRPRRLRERRSQWPWQRNDVEAPGMGARGEQVNGSGLPRSNRDDRIQGHGTNFSGDDLTGLRGPGYNNMLAMRPYAILSRGRLSKAVRGGRNAVIVPGCWVGLV